MARPPERLFPMLTMIVMVLTVVALVLLSYVHPHN
jgi:hypothetical protein